MSNRKRKSHSRDSSDGSGSRVRVVGTRRIVQPAMLVKCLKKLNEMHPHILDHRANEVFNYILQNYMSVDSEKEVTSLKLEVEDKLECAVSADLLGKRQNGRYYAFNAREAAQHRAFASELMFWALYKRRVESRKEKSTERTDGKRKRRRFM